MSYRISQPDPVHLDAMLGLLPRLASFELPSRREPQELWTGDAELVRKWAAGELPESIFRIALAENGEVVGIAFATFRPEALSQKPSAHLEVLAVAEHEAGKGVGKLLVTAVESEVKARGCTYLTLNVFMRNEKARGFYGRLGFDEELLRCIKEV